MKVKPHDWVFSVVLSVGLRTVLQVEIVKIIDTAKSECFCDFYAFSK